MTLPIEETLVHLEDSGQPLLNSQLTELSNLSSEELKGFQHSWATIEAKRRKQIIHRLVDLTEENLELNFDSIFKYCLKDEDAEVQSQAIDGLWENEEPSLINPLINLLKQASSEKVQVATATALGKFVMLAEDRKLRSCHVTSLQEALLAAIGDKSKTAEVRRRALEAAAPFCTPQVKTAIMEAYQSQDTSLRASSIYAMGKNCDPSWLPILQKELDSADAERRYEAAGACGELEEEDAVPDLARLLNDPDNDVRLAAIQALGKIGGTQAKEYLEVCINSPSEAIRQAALQALREIASVEDPLSFRF